LQTIRQRGKNRPDLPAGKAGAHPPLAEKEEKVP